MTLVEAETAAVLAAVAEDAIYAKVVPPSQKVAEVQDSLQGQANEAGMEVNPKIDRYQNAPHMHFSSFTV